MEKWRIGMIEALTELASRDEDVLNALTRLKNGKVEDAVADLAENLRFNHLGVGLEFTDRERLREFFEKERELYPGFSFRTKKTLVAEDHVIAEWLLEYTIKGPFYGNTLRDVPVSLHGVSVIRTSKGKITEWSDYYDGLTSRRTALTSCFTDWIEY
jgi:ketosteroid isomerase-like protein